MATMTSSLYFAKSGFRLVSKFHTQRLLIRRTAGTPQKTAEEKLGSRDSRHYETGIIRRLHTDNVHKKDDYFKIASFGSYSFVISGLAAYEVLCFQTKYYPFELLGSPGQGLLYLAENHMPWLQFGFCFSIFLHIVEGMYAYYRCKSINLSDTATKKWTIQTLTLGYFSLRHLNAYCKQKNKSYP